MACGFGRFTMELPDKSDGAKKWWCKPNRPVPDLVCPTKADSRPDDAVKLAIPTSLRITSRREQIRR